MEPTPEMMQAFSILTREQIKFLLQMAREKGGELATSYVAGTPGKFDDLVWGLTERMVWNEPTFDKIGDLIADRLGIPA